MADQAANGEPSPESRLYSAGFSRRLDFWCPPGEERTLDLNDAIAMLDAGEVKPNLPSWPGVHPDTVAGFQTSEEEMDRILGRNQPDPEPPPLPSWAEPWAELLAEKLKPVVRAEVRAGIKAEARRQAREQT